MRRLTLVVVICALGVAAILAAGGPVADAAASDVLKCVDCEGQTCHVVYGPASRNCLALPEGCMSWEDCGT